MPDQPLRIDLRSLRSVVAISERGSFARAATSLGVTQSALSRSIQALEDALGAKLFDRGKAGAVATSAGQLLVEQGRRLLSDARGLEREVRMLQSVEMGALVVGCGTYPAELSVGAAAGRMMALYPNIHLRLLLADWPELVRKVLDEVVDLAVCEISAISDGRLAVEVLPEHEAVLFCRQGHPLSKKKSVSLAQVRQFPIVLQSIPPRASELLPDQGSEAIAVLEPNIHVDTYGLARQVVLGSDAIGIAVRSQLRGDPNVGKLHALPFRAAWLRSRYGFVRLARRTPSPSANAFMAIVRTIEVELHD